MKPNAKVIINRNKIKMGLFPNVKSIAKSYSDRTTERETIIGYITGLEVVKVRR